MSGDPRMSYTPGHCLYCGEAGGHGNLPCPHLVSGRIEFASYEEPRPPGAVPVPAQWLDPARGEKKIDRIIELLERIETLLSSPLRQGRREKWRLLCPDCDGSTFETVFDETEVTDREGQTFLISDYERSRCTNCGFTFVSPKQSRANDLKWRDVDEDWRK